MKRIIAFIAFMAIDAHACCATKKPNFENIRKRCEMLSKNSPFPDDAVRSKIVLDICEAVAKTHPNLVILADDAMKTSVAFMAELKKHHEDLLRTHPEYVQFCESSGFTFPKKTDEKKGVVFHF